MPKAFAPVDDLLIERLFQPVSDLITNRIGVSRTAAACLCADVACLAWIISRARGLSDAVVAWNANDAFLDLALLLLGMIALISLRMLFQRAGRQWANPLRLTMRPHRAIVLLMLVSSLSQFNVPCMPETADLAMLLCAASALYLGACVERPPFRRSAPSLARAAEGA